LELCASWLFELLLFVPQPNLLQIPLTFIRPCETQGTLGKSHDMIIAEPSVEALIPSTVLAGWINPIVWDFHY
jgi:hypothetical protein